MARVVLTPSRPPPFRGWRRRLRRLSHTIGDEQASPLQLCPLPLKGGGWEGVKSHRRRPGELKLLRGSCRESE
jgi:hypothetical protein